MAVNDDELVVTRAMKQGFEMHGSGGSSLNPHPNEFFISASGSFDLLKIAQNVIMRLDQHREAKRVAKAASDAQAYAEASKGD